MLASDDLASLWGSRCRYQTIIPFSAPLESQLRICVMLVLNDLTILRGTEVWELTLSLQDYRVPKTPKKSTSLDNKHNFSVSHRKPELSILVLRVQQILEGGTSVPSSIGRACVVGWQIDPYNDLVLGKPFLKIVSQPTR